MASAASFWLRYCWQWEHYYKKQMGNVQQLAVKEIERLPHNLENCKTVFNTQKDHSQKMRKKHLQPYLLRVLRQQKCAQDRVARFAL